MNNRYPCRFLTFRWRTFGQLLPHRRDFQVASNRCLAAGYGASARRAAIRPCGSMREVSSAEASGVEVTASPLSALPVQFQIPAPGAAAGAGALTADAAERGHSLASGMWAGRSSATQTPRSASLVWRPSPGTIRSTPVARGAMPPALAMPARCWRKPSSLGRWARHGHLARSHQVPTSQNVIMGCSRRWPGTWFSRPAVNVEVVLVRRLSGPFQLCRAAPVWSEQPLGVLRRRWPAVPHRSSCWSG